MGQSRASRFLVLGCAFALACATARPRTADSPQSNALPLTARVQAPGFLFELLYTQADNAEVAHIGSTLLTAGPRLARWGSFKQGVFVRVYPDHDALEQAIEKKNYPWLRAWAYGDQILLQSPRSWSAPTPAALDEELQELLAHELTHSLMYQLMEPSDGPSLGAEIPFEEPPIWFSEGMASVTAGQGHRRMSSEELTSWMARNPGGDPLRPSAELVRTEKEAVYGAAHRAFDLLVAIAGDQSIRDVLRAVRAGARFRDAFKVATGFGLSEFENEALRSGFDPLAAQLSTRPAAGAGGP